jgi:cytochrome P450
MFHVILILISIILFLKYIDYVNYRRIINIKTGEYIKSESIIENFLKLIFSKKSNVNKIIELKEKYNENIFGTYIYGRFSGFLVVITNHDLAKQVFQEDSKIFVKEENKVNIKFIQKLFGKTNVVLSNGEEWKRQRFSMNKSFHDLTKYKKIFEEKSDITYDIIKNNLIQDNIQLLIQKFTLDVLGRSILDFEFNSLTDSFQKIILSYNNIISTFTSPLNILKSALKEKLFRVENKDVNEMSKFINDLVNKSKEKMKDNIEPKSIIDHMVLSNKLSDEELNHNTFIIFFAGYNKFLIIK